MLRDTGDPAFETVAQGTVSGWENGKVPGLEALAALARFYRVAFEWLASGVGPKERLSVPEAQRRLAVIQQLLAAGLRYANGDELKEMEAFLETIPMVVERPDPVDR